MQTFQTTKIETGRVWIRVSSAMFDHVWKMQKETKYLDIFWQSAAAKTVYSSNWIWFIKMTMMITMPKTKLEMMINVDPGCDDDDDYEYGDADSDD